MKDAPKGTLEGTLKGSPKGSLDGTPKGTLIIRTLWVCQATEAYLSLGSLAYFRVCCDKA